MEKAVSKESVFRYERKAVFSSYSPFETETLAKHLPGFFSEIFHKRFVNNIYFDTGQLRNYFDNIDGNKSRTKVRIRWYGNLFGLIESPVLELKKKEGLVGTKIGYKLSPFVMDKNIHMKNLQQVFTESNLSASLLESLKIYEPTLLNRYSRMYLLSFNKKFRITIDNNLEYYSISRMNNRFLNKFIDSNNIVFELKYAVENDKSASRIMSKLNERVYKNSKYINGIEVLDLW